MKTIPKALVILLIGLLIGGICVSFCLFFSIYFFMMRTPKQEESTTKMHKYTEISPLNNKTKSGFVGLTRKLMDDEFISYNNEETGSFFLISNFGGSDYECSGSCFCNTEDTDRRYSSSIFTLNKGLFVLLTAISASLAYQMASETFKNECIQKYSGFCEPENIESDVHVCEMSETKDSTSSSSPGNILGKSVTDSLGNERKKLVYDCFGTCLGNENFKPSKLNIEGLSERPEIVSEMVGACEKYNTKTQIGLESDLSGADASTRTFFRNKAKKEFIRGHLAPYCEHMSNMIYVAISLGKLNGVSQERIDSEMKGIIEIMEEARGEEDLDEFYNLVLSCVGEQKGGDSNHVECVESEF